MKTYPVDRLYEEMAYIAYHFHWSYETLLNLSHAERLRWCSEITKINEKISSELKKKL
jgi:hypothetical protein